MSEVQARHCMTPEQWTWFLCNVRVIPTNKLLLQEMNQLIRIEQLTSSFLEKFGSYSYFPGRGKCPFWPTCGPVAQPGILFCRGQSLTPSEFNLSYFGRRWFWCHSSISGLLQQDMTWNIFYHSASNSWNWYQAPAKNLNKFVPEGPWPLLPHSGCATAADAHGFDAPRAQNCLLEFSVKAHR